ncbi:hypothetical protein FOZ62_010780 [Perkinsus olseni]|uniref:Uncharacterized protein n=1 Tax=Perkinsus olseni TaxID=32597 RepID=A0A7J6S9W9_PEROL|nr:hypothetical protein FOZ62_010780 [Perkinsus olseni]
MTASVRRIRMADSGLRNSGGSAVSHGFSLSSSIGSSVYSSMEVPRTEYDQLSPSSSSSSSRSTDEASPASRGMQVRKSVISLRVPSHRPVRSASLAPRRSASSIDHRSLQDHSHRRSRSLVDDFVTSSYQAPDAEVSLDLTPTSVCSSAPQRTEQVIPNMLSTESVPPEVSNEPVEETEVTPEVQPPDDDDVLAGYLAAARTEPKRRSPGKPPLSRSSSSPTLATAIRNVRRSMGALSDPDSPEKPTSEAESPDRSTERGSLNSVCGFGSPVRPFSIDRVAEGEIEIPVVERLQGAVICAEDLDACEVPLENGLTIRVGYPERGWVSVFARGGPVLRVRPSGVGVQYNGEEYRLRDIESESEVHVLYHTAREIIDRLRETTVRIRADGDQNSFLMADDIAVSSRTSALRFDGQDRPWKGSVSVKEVKVVGDESVWKFLCNGLDLPAVSVPVSVVDKSQSEAMEVLIKRETATTSMAIDINAIVALMTSVWPSVISRRGELIERDFDAMARAHSEYLQKMRASAIPKDILAKLGGISSAIAASGG